MKSYKKVWYFTAQNFLILYTEVLRTFGLFMISPLIGLLQVIWQSILKI